VKFGDYSEILVIEILMVPSKMCKCAVPPDHSRSEIHSWARATFQNIAEARKQDVIRKQCLRFRIL